MEKKLRSLMQEVIFGSSDSAISRQISKLEKEGKIKKIAPRLYTSNLQDTPENIVRRNLFQIIGQLYPGALLSHRSAIEIQPTATGQLFLTYKYTRKATLPGITLRFLEGPGPMEGDNEMMEGLYVSQRERAFLENLQTTRKKPGPDNKTLTYPDLEEKLEKILATNDEKALNEVRDRARKIAKELDMQHEFTRLDQIIGALLATKTSNILKSRAAAARALGKPFDPYRMGLFEILFRELKQREFKYRGEKNTSNEAFRNFAFFESYFSNFIEGTEFEIEEAKQIIETQVPLPARDEDSHDILGTYQLVSSREEMRTIPTSGEELIDILKYRHRILLSARTSKKPGQFKETTNVAGRTTFVEPELVMGTLLQGFDYYNALVHPFARAAYMMFLISDIHPFNDGNGRIARVMMNAELVKEDQCKIIIPTVFRDDYLGALRKLSRRKDPDPYIRMLSKAHEFSATIAGTTMDEMHQILETSQAFMEHTEGKLTIVGE